MKMQWLQFACVLTFFLIATCTMAYTPYNSYESSDSTYNKVPTTVVKSEDFKVPSESEKEYKSSFLPKNDYYKKPSILEDNYKKVSSVPKHESFLPKNDYYKKPLFSEDNYKKESYVLEVPSKDKPEYKESFLPKFDYFKQPSFSEDNYKKTSYVPEVSSMAKPE